MNAGNSNGQYQVLSPWADSDPVPLKGLIASRLTDLAGKKIGLNSNWKVAAVPILTVVERELKKRYPTCQTIWFKDGDRNYAEWAKGLDAVVVGVGD